MVDTIPDGQKTSACPTFGKAWNPNDEICLECKQYFVEEHDKCKEISQHKSKGVRVVSETNEPKVAEVIETQASEPQAPGPQEQEVKKWKGFRKGSRAQYILTCLETAEGPLSVEDLTTLVSDQFNIQEADAKATVISYTKEWAEGAWGSVKRDFPFTITYPTKDTILFEAVEVVEEPAAE